MKLILYISYVPFDRGPGQEGTRGPCLAPPWHGARLGPPRGTPGSEAGCATQNVAVLACGMFSFLWHEFISVKIAFTVSDYRRF